MRSVAIDTAFWTNLEALFRSLFGPIRLVGTLTAGGWSLSYEGSGDREGRNRLRQRFTALAERAAIAVGILNEANKREAWLNFLREESPHFHSIESSSYDGVVEMKSESGWIQDLALASAEYCTVCATRAFKRQMARPY